jgi:hypothetical protein
MTRNILKLSENSRNSEKLILAHKSLAKVLNSRSAEVEPCANPENVGKCEEKFPKCEQQRF